MKHIIKKILREQKDEIIQAPSFAFFDYNWNDVLDWADDRLFRINGNINLSNTEITTLGGLVEVGGDLDLMYCKNLQSLGKLRSVGVWLNLYNCRNLQSLGELESVGGDLSLFYCKNLQSLGELRSVGYDLYLKYTAIAKKMTDEEIRNQVDVKGNIIR